MDRREYLFKVLVVGECETGKTSFITQYVHKRFENNYKATVSVQICSLTTFLAPPNLHFRSTVDNGHQSLLKNPCAQIN